MNKVFIKCLVAGAAILSIASHALAANPSMTVTFTWPAMPYPTCTFNDETQTVILDDITSKTFTDTGVRNVTSFTVGIMCEAGITAVSVVPTGTPDSNDDTAFSNTGSSEHVALRLLDKDSRVLLPDGSTRVNVVPTDSREASYTFSAGYVATAAGEVTPGSFASTVTLSFEYD